MSYTSTSINLRLEPFSRDNADLVLSWRNAHHVRANSLNDSEITREDHLAFVDGLSDRPDRNFFVLHLDGRPEAVFNVNLDGAIEWGGAMRLLYRGAKYASTRPFPDTARRCRRFRLRPAQV